eukprot:CAMPEP_0183355858 /NCGR_PEP_ID=MMETSP0164_2-20130417/42121_1 /TAXON_ID=221442 /ORGANISM="Coccolithus pelagicus ssp braarudi, Strain PLY182g" /LENGTH=513 /DNA_ID=CAMNT_0025529099 /DNA_START=44 /DNA_END=1585 /DNA_ORIENTATION=+
MASLGGGAASDADRLVDRHGVPADSTLFFDKMPASFTEGQLRALIQDSGGGTEELINIWFGTKALAPGESRTATARFNTVEAAVHCRQLLQQYQQEDWMVPLRVNFVRKREGRGDGAKRPRMEMASLPPQQQQFSPLMNMGMGMGMDPNMAGALGMQLGMAGMNPQMMQQMPGFGFANANVGGAAFANANVGGPGFVSASGESAFLDKHRTPACPTLFLPNLPHNATEQTVRALFPTSTGIYCSTKPLASTERRTSYCSFENTETAIHERQRLDNVRFCDVPCLAELGPGSVERLVVSFSKRGQGRVWSANERRPKDAQNASAGSYAAANAYMPAGGPGYMPTSQNFGSHSSSLCAAVAHSTAMLGERDRSRGGAPCPTLFVTRMPRTATEETVRALFPLATRVFCSRKPLREGEDRTAYVSFESTQVAVSERQRVHDYRMDPHGDPLHVTFSTKPQDREGAQPQLRAGPPSAQQPPMHLQHGHNGGGLAPAWHDYGCGGEMASCAVLGQHGF